MKPSLHRDTLSCESTSADKEKGRVVPVNFFCLTLGEVMALIIRDQLLNKPKTHLRKPPNYYYKLQDQMKRLNLIFPFCQPEYSIHVGQASFPYHFIINSGEWCWSF